MAANTVSSDAAHVLLSEVGTVRKEYQEPDEAEAIDKTRALANVKVDEWLGKNELAAEVANELYVLLDRLLTAQGVIPFSETIGIKVEINALISRGEIDPTFGSTLIKMVNSVRAAWDAGKISEALANAQVLSALSSSIPSVNQAVSFLVDRLTPVGSSGRTWTINIFTAASHEEIFASEWNGFGHRIDKGSLLSPLRDAKLTTNPFKLGSLRSICEIDLKDEPSIFAVADSEAMLSVFGIRHIIRVIPSGSECSGGGKPKNLITVSGLSADGSLSAFAVYGGNLVHLGIGNSAQVILGWNGKLSSDLGASYELELGDDWVAYTNRGSITTQLSPQGLLGILLAAHPSTRALVIMMSVVSIDLSPDNATPGQAKLTAAVSDPPQAQRPDDHSSFLEWQSSSALMASATKDAGGFRRAFAEARCNITHNLGEVKLETASQDPLCNMTVTAKPKPPPSGPRGEVDTVWEITGVGKQRRFLVKSPWDEVRADPKDVVDFKAPPSPPIPSGNGVLRVTITVTSNPKDIAFAVPGEEDPQVSGIEELPP